MTRVPYDASRRRFFRSFAGDVFAGAVQALGAVDALRGDLAEGARTYLSDPPREATSIPSDPEAGAAAFRYQSPARLLVVDQRALPDRVAETPIETAAEAAWAIRDGVVAEGPVSGQVAAAGLALTASRSSGASGSIIRSLLEGSANALRSARPSDRHMLAAIDRMMARYRSIDVGASGEVVAAALRIEAEAIAVEAAEDHARVADAGAEILALGDGGIVNVLTHGATGPLAGGRAGTALAAIVAAQRANPSLHVWVDETRPGLEGSRLTAWELARAGVRHTLIADAVAGQLIRSGRVDAVLVGARRIAANGDVANTAGTYPLAVLAARHRVPFYVCAPLAAVDPALPNGTCIAIDEGDPGQVSSIAGVRAAPVESAVANPMIDVTPAELVAAFATDEGVLGAPFERELALAIARRDARRSAGGPGAGA